jgi:hypothetical protein
MRIINKMVVVLPQQAPAGMHHTDSPSALPATVITYEIQTFCQAIFVATHSGIYVNCQSVQLKGEDVRLLQPTG